MSRCFHADVADGVLQGRLSDDELARVLKHAAGCAKCRRLLARTGRPAGDPLAVGTDAMDAIQDRLTAWRATRRAPMMPAFPWHKGHEVDRYVITRSVGGTDDGVIYEAFDPEREERVVVKQLDLHVEDPAVPALMAVARQLCKFSHPNVLQMRSVGVHAGSVYVVHEFVKSTPLPQAGGDDPRQVIALFAEAARGLAAAHDAGIVHGWFSAASCVVGRDGRLRVLDFGIGEARVHRTAATAATRARGDDDWTVSTGQISSEDSFVGFVPRRRHPTSGQFESIVLAAGPTSLGPRIYAAPELVLGAPSSPASDQFALCAALFHRLHGAPPFDGDTVALWLRELLAGRVARPAPRGDIPPAVDAALLRGLERDPAARFDRMADLAAALERRGLRGGRRTVAAVAAGIGIAAASLLVAGAQRSGATRPRDAGRCDQRLAGWDTLWSAARQDELSRATGSVADAWPVLRARFDDWFGAWRTATHGFCAAPDREPACAARARGAAADLLQLVADGAPSRLVRAAAAVDALPTPSQCASTAPSPATAPIAAIQADVRRRLGLLDEADPLVARPPDDPAQRAYQSVVRGHTAADRGDVLEARRLFENATFEAAAAHQPELGTSAALQRLALSCSAPERGLWSGYLTAQLALGSRASSAQPAYRGALAESLTCEGKLADAIALRQDVARDSHGDATADGAAAALSLAQVLVAHGELAGAEPAARDAAAIYARIWGAHHPQAQAARLTIAETQVASAAAMASASAEIERVIAELADRKEADATRARALLLQGRIADARGDRDEALRLLARAAQEYEAALGGTHPALAIALLAAADAQLAAGHDQDAEVSYRQVAAILDTLGQTESAAISHARAGILLARWGDHPPADATDTLQWGLAPTGDALDPAVAGWVAEQLGRSAAARNELPAALAHYRAATTAWQQSGDPRGLGSARTAAALLAARLHDPDARAMLELALPAATSTARPRLQLALAKLLWPVQRDRARSLARAALADLPDGSTDAAELTRWLNRRDDR